MNKLGLTCRVLDEGFRERLDTVNTVVNTRLPEGYHEGTTVQTTLASLVTQTTLADLPTEQHLRELGSWTAEKQAEIDAVEEQLQKDPQVMIRLRSEAKRALEIVREEVSAIEADLADAALAAINRIQQEAETTSRAVEVAARALFSNQPISDLGSEPVQLGPPHRLRPAIPRRRRLAQHLLHRPPVDAEPPARLVMAQPLVDNR